MATLPAEELLEIVTLDAAEYRGDALDLARAELQKRGYSESDLERLRQSAGERPLKTDWPFPRLRFALTLVLTLIVTFLLFAPIIYYSLDVYGIPCAIFLAMGYLLWLALRRNAPKQALAFAIGFICIVAPVLFLISIELPWYTAYITGEFMALLALIKLVSASVSHSD
ncbi:MAG TPA: hypothetical protein VFS90_21605 [Pyrinomonadaceae bacterium]|nr:hypothetical protein [Pyrinomonadaceae bacterium]